MSSENKDSTPSSSNNSQNNSNQPDTYYQRKKNLISGFDNDQLNFGLSLLGIAIGSIAAIPIAKNIWEYFVNRPPVQLPPNPPLPPPIEEPIIPPTPPVSNGQQNTVVNGGVQPNEQPKEEPKVEEEDDGLFHDSELRRRQKLMGQRPRTRYDSPFGKDIGGL